MAASIRYAAHSFGAFSKLAMCKEECTLKVIRLKALYPKSLLVLQPQIFEKHYVRGVYLMHALERKTPLVQTVMCN